MLVSIQQTPKMVSNILRRARGILGQYIPSVIAVAVAAADRAAANGGGIVDLTDGDVYPREGRRSEGRTGSVGGHDGREVERRKLANDPGIMHASARPSVRR